MTAETVTPDSDVVTDPAQKQLDHIDEMLHECLTLLRQVEPLLPLIPRWQALLDPGAAMRRSFGRSRHAVPQREAAPVHVRPASADSAEVGA